MNKIRSSRLVTGVALASLALTSITMSTASAAPKATTYKIGFANETLQSSFCVDVQSGMVVSASAAGDKLVILNNNSSDTTALQNAQILANDKVNAVVEFQQDSKIGPAIAQIYQKAGIKTVIAIDIPQTNAIFFGASNYGDGVLTGKRLGQTAKGKGWSAANTYLVSVGLPAAGAVPALRMQGMADGISATFPGITKSHILNLNGSGDTADSQTAVASALPKIPSGDHFIIVGINDESTLGGLNAAQVAGRASMAIEGSQGGDAVGINQIKTNKNWIGDTEYFPEYYAKYIFTLLHDIQLGKKVTPYVFMPHVFLNTKNINKYYPGTATSAVVAPPGGIIFSKTAKSSI